MKMDTLFCSGKVGGERAKVVWPLGLGFFSQKRSLR